MYRNVSTYCCLYLSPLPSTNYLNRAMLIRHRLGGRLTDLEFFARRLKTGQSPKRAVAEIIDQSASEILKMYLLTIDKSNLKWSTEQVSISN